MSGRIYMEKNAQDRGLLNRLRDKSNITGRILESLNPEFQEMMEKLRATDEKIRGHAAEVKTAVRGAKSFTNRRDYLSAAGSMSAFHERCRWIAHELQKFINGVDLKHYKFLLDQFDDEQKQQLFGYDPNYEIKPDDEMSAADAKVVTAALKKKAGLSDWWFKVTDPIEDAAHNLTTQRGIAMRALEKRFSISFLKELKANTQVMVARTQKFLQILLATFKRLATALAKRNVDQYVEAAKSFISKFANYHAQFVKYYEKAIVPLKTQHKKLQDEALEVSRKEQEDKSREMEPAAPAPAAQKAFVPPAQPVAVQDRRRPGEPAAMPETQEQPFQQNLRDLLGKDFDEWAAKPKGPIAPTPLKVAPRKAETFISTLEKTSDPKSLLLEILAYSEEIEDVEPDASLKLLAIAEGITEDYKTAGIFDFMGKKNQPVPGQQAATPTPPVEKDEHDPLA